MSEPAPIVDKKGAAGEEESHNNMFIVLSSLKSGNNKNVSSLYAIILLDRTIS